MRAFTCLLYQANNVLEVLILDNNPVAETGGTQLIQAIGSNTTIKYLGLQVMQGTTFTLLADYFQCI